MGCLGNILWFLCGGAVSGLSWCLAGCLWCITIIGIPVGLQCFKFGIAEFLSFRKRSQIWRGRRFISFKCCLADCFGAAVGFGTRRVWRGTLCDNYRNTIWAAAF